MVTTTHPTACDTVTQTENKEVECTCAGVVTGGTLLFNSGCGPAQAHIQTHSFTQVDFNEACVIPNIRPDKPELSVRK